MVGLNVDVGGNLHESAKFHGGPGQSDSKGTPCL